MFRKISRRRFLKYISVGIPGLTQLTSCSATDNDNTFQADPVADDQPVVRSFPYSGAPVLSALRDFGTDWQIFWCCDLADNGGRLGVVIDGTVLYEGDFLLPEKDYTGLVKAINLSPGAHTYQLAIDGVRVGSVYPFTSGLSSGDEFSMLFIADTTSEAGSAFSAICSREDDIAYVVGAELHYLDTRGLFGGQPDLSDGNASANTLDEPESKASYQKQIRQQYRFSRTFDADASGRVLLDNKWPVFNVPGNHDFYLADSGGLDNYRRQPGRCLYDAAHDAAFEYVSNGNPVAEGVTDSSPTPVNYFNKAIADVDLIVTDGVSYSDPFAVGYLGKNSHISNNNTAGDDLQESWLLNRLASSTGNLIIIVFSTMVHGQTSNWSQTISDWLKVNMTDKSIILMTPDTHQSFALFHKGASIPEFGFSTTAAVTAAKNYYVNPGFVDVYDSDMYNKFAVISGDQTFSGAGPAIINVVDSSLFRSNRKMSLTPGGRVYNVVDVGDSTISVINVDGSPPSFSVTDGTRIYSIDWPDQDDIVTNSVGKRLCTYGKVTRYPAGNSNDANPHTRVQLKETYTGNIKFECRIRDGERLVRI